MIMDPTQLGRFETLCSDLYSSSNQASRKNAHDTLMPLLGPVESIPQLEFVLGNSTNPHAILFASNGLIQLITNHWTSLPETQRDELKSFLMTYLSQQCGAMYANPLSEQAMSFMIRLLCRIVKLSWLEGPKYQTIVGEVQAFIDGGSIAQAILAVDIFTALSGEMQPTKGVQMARHRRTAMSFRDVSLGSIFQTAMKILQNLFRGNLKIADKGEESRLVHKVLKLVVSSLSFDFMGTMPDETAEDQSTVMVPYTWTHVKDVSYPSLFFDLYMTCVSANRRACAVLSLQCLVLLASLRRSLYSKEEERVAMLGSFIKGTSQILSSRAGLDDDECYHEFCRLLGRINAANQLTELSSNPQFGAWIDQVHVFTSHALREPDRLPNSMHYLLGFWTVLVAPMISMGSKAPEQVRQYLEQVVVLFLQGRLAGASDSLQDETLLMEQLEVVSTLSKLFLKQCHSLLVAALESAKEEEKIVWIVYLMSAVIGGNTEMLHSAAGRHRSRSVDDSPLSSMTLVGMSESLSQEYVLMGDMIKRIFSLVEQTDESYRTVVVSEDLELAYLYFLDQVKKVFLAEQAKITALVTSRSEGLHKLCQAIGVDSDAALIDLIVKKLLNNYRHKKSMEAVVKKSLWFMNDLIAVTTTVYVDESRSSSSSMSHVLASNERMKYLISHQEVIDFNRIDKNYNSLYYSILFSIIFAEKLAIDWSYLNSLFAQVAQKGVHQKSPEQGKLVATLARNLKGVSLAATSSESFNILFKYLVENPKNASACKISLFSAAADVWWDEPQVVVPVLKFIADFALNKSQRIVFDSNSPNGLLLFREAVKVLSAYGQRMLQRPSNFPYKDIYEEKYKGIGAALALYTNTLGGGYANLGVFELYGDTTLQVSMSTALSLCLSIPLNDLSAFIKSLKSVYTFTELVTKSHMSSLMQIGPGKFAHVLRALEDGLTSFDTSIGLSCCVAVDNICSYAIQCSADNVDDFTAVQTIINNQEVRASLSRLLALLNHLSVSGEFASTWSLSRPFLSLILLANNEFLQLRNSVILQQITPERRQLVESCYNDLMSGINQTLSTKNRELFTKNLYQFGICLRSK